ncbi:MAG TPA: hypothetical protein VJH55_02090 [Candidatus Paceibacterota bacterium]
MGFGLSLSCGTRLSQRCGIRLVQRQALTLEQKHLLRQTHISDGNDRYLFYLGLMSTVHGHKMSPSARCPKCVKGLSVAEIILGFKRDLNDFTTECPRCKTRFEATNLLDKRTGKEAAFWCRDQTIERLPGKEHLSPMEFKEQHPHIYFSALFWFGSLLNAFRQRKIEYRKEMGDWMTKARFCLGQIPDQDVASIFGVKKLEVTVLRKQFRINGCKGKKSVIPANWSISLTT